MAEAVFAKLFGLEQNTTVIIFQLDAGVTNLVGVHNICNSKVITFREVKMFVGL